MIGFWTVLFLLDWRIQLSDETRHRFRILPTNRLPPAVRNDVLSGLHPQLFCVGSLEFQSVSHRNGYTRCTVCHMWLRDTPGYPLTVRRHERRYFPGEPVRIPSLQIQGEIVRANSEFEYVVFTHDQTPTLVTVNVRDIQTR